MDAQQSRKVPNNLAGGWSKDREAQGDERRKDGGSEPRNKKPRERLSLRIAHASTVSGSIQEEANNQQVIFMR